MLGTLLFHLLLVLLFILTALTTPLPLPEEEGIIINLGSYEAGAGMEETINEPENPTEEVEEIEETVVEESDPRVTPEETMAEEILTQDVEEAPAIETKQPEPKEVVKDPDPVEEPVEQPAEESKPEKPTEEPKEEPKEEPRKPNPLAMYTGSNDKTGEGNKDGNKDQGDPEGAVDHDGQPNAKGNKGIHFDLTGRGIKTYPDIELQYLTRKEIVVVDVTVDRDGNVTRAKAGARGSTSTNQTLWKKAEQAAKRTKFTPKSDAPEFQKGTITFVFIPE